MRSSESVSFIAKAAFVASALVGPQACSMRDPDDVAKIEKLEEKLAAKNDPKAATEVNAECSDIEGKLHDCLGVVQKCKLNEIEGEALKKGATDLVNAAEGALGRDYEGFVDNSTAYSLEVCTLNLEICRSVSDSFKNAYETCMSDVSDTINKLARPSVK